MEEYAENTDDDRAEDRDGDRTHGPGLEAGLDVHAAEVGDDVEIAVVEERGANRGQTDRCV